MTISPMRGHAPAECTITKFGMRGRVADVIICFKFYRNRSRVFRAVRGRKLGSSIDFDSRPYNRSALPCCLWWFPNYADLNSLDYYIWGTVFERYDFQPKSNISTSRRTSCSHSEINCLRAQCRCTLLKRLIRASKLVADTLNVVRDKLCFLNR